MVSETRLILQELKGIKQDLDYIKKSIVDVDLVLTEDDVESIKEAELDLRKGRTKRLI